MGCHLFPDLVSSEETQGVWVVLERLHHAEDVGQVTGIVRTRWVGAINGLARKWAVDVQDHVNADGVEDAGALVVVERRVDVVRANGVDLEGMA